VIEALCRKYFVSIQTRREVEAPVLLVHIGSRYRWGGSARRADIRTLEVRSRSTPRSRSAFLAGPRDLFRSPKMGSPAISVYV
jgi:hypothetical protein